jgi:hypothetical protein
MLTTAVSNNLAESQTNKFPFMGRQQNRNGLSHYKILLVSVFD